MLWNIACGNTYPHKVLKAHHGDICLRVFVYRLLQELLNFSHQLVEGNNDVFFSPVDR
jgi:hypothetical protein